MQNRRQQRCIQDFGEQWTAFPDNRGYYGSKELLEDICRPLIEAEEVRGCRVAEIGAGTGRIVNMLLDAGASHVVAVEPSQAVHALKRNVRQRSEQVTVLPTTGEQIPPSAELDWAFSIGVLHHIPEPEPVVQAMYRALRPGGRILIWLYGREGNRLLLFFLLPLRTITQRLPHSVLNLLVSLIDLPLRLYMTLCRHFPLPLRGYLNNVLGHFNPAERRLVIYDQLNPAYAKYYTRHEAVDLLRKCGFHDIRVHHRHGYSWTVMGTKPDCARAAA
jgi:SAM-dependent methyltransferase